MKATLRLSSRATYADYLAAEQNSRSRHEYIDGVIVAMAGGSDEHNALTSRLTALCALRLTGTCRHYSPDQRSGSRRRPTAVTAMARSSTESPSTPFTTSRPRPTLRS